MVIEDEGSYFRQLVRDAVHDIETIGSACCFNKDQYNEIVKQCKCEVKCRFEDSFYYISRKDGSTNNLRKGDGNHENKKGHKTSNCTNRL